jgi:hypothetical protein
MAHGSLHRIEVSRGTPGTPSALSNLMLTGLFALALAGSFYVSWLWAAR